MKKFVKMYAKFTFIILLTAIAILSSIVFDIVEDIICMIILFQNKFDMTVMRADIAEVIEGKRVELKNTLNAFKEIIED